MQSNNNSKTSFYIVTPSYNQGQFIEKTIRSVLDQVGNFNINYIVVDGKSSDSTFSILKKYQKMISFLYEKDDGQTDAINKGIQALTENVNKYKNAYFAFINSDDYYLPNAFTTVDRFFKEHQDKNWLIGDSVIVDADSKEIQKPVRLYKKVVRTFLSTRILGILNPIPQPSTFLRLEVLHQTGVFNTNLRYTMDYEYWLRLFMNSHKPIVIKKALAAFRIHNQSKGGSQFTKQFSEELNVAKKFFSNWFIIFLHQLHNLLIIIVYKLIKH